MKVYPSTRYHADGSTCVVNDADEDAHLGPGWADTPAAFTKEDLERPRRFLPPATTRSSKSSRT